MAEVSRTRYHIDLSTWRPRSNEKCAIIRPVTRDDRDALGALMLDGYRGTIDDEGESIDDAYREIDEWYGDDPLLGHSRAAVVDGELASAVLIMLVDEAPFVAFVVTAAEHKGNGLGGDVVDAALASLERSGYERVGLVITDGNVPSERLFTNAGAEPRTGTEEG